MHLSILTDTFLSDSLNDAGSPIRLDAPRLPGRKHLEGLLRGIAVILLLAVPFGLTCGAQAFHAATPPHPAAATFILDRGADR